MANEIYEQIINRFDGGMVNDPREPWRNQCRVSKHFDILTDPHRMVPYLSNETEGVGDTEKFVQIVSSGTTLKQYALGVVTGTTRAQIFERTAGSGSWAASTTATDSNTGRNHDFFIEYKDILYGVRNSTAALGAGGTNIWSWNTSTNAFQTNSLALAATATDMTCPPVIHSLDDKLYGAYDNFIFSKNGGAHSANWTDPALTLPTNLVVTSICEYGIYLAIACRSKYSNGKSVVFLWDRDSTVTTLTARIDWGTGDIAWIQELNGILIGASRLASTGVISSRIIFKYYNGSGAVVFKELLASSTNVLLDQHTVRANRRIYFMMALGLTERAFVGLSITGRVVLEGVFSIGINSLGQYTLTHERVLNNNTDTTITTTGASTDLHGFFFQGDQVTVMYIDSSAYVALRSNNDSALSANSRYESLIFDGGNVTKKKKLVGVSVSHEPLPSGASATVYYKKDSDTSWSSAILTSNTANDVEKSAPGLSLPEYKEIQFRIDSTGGAVITGLRFRYQIEESRAY